MVAYDRSLFFGMSRFLWVKSDTTDLTYDYDAFMSREGSILIMKSKKDDTEANYWIGQGVFTTVWADKANKTYVLPNQLLDQTFEV